AHLERDVEHNYSKGVRYLDKRDWDNAVKYFDRVIQAGADRADGAHYWKAYAEYKRGERDNALTALKKLQEGFPKSRWLEEGKALEMEVREASKSGAPDQPDTEDLKLMALNGLLHSD